MIPSEKLSLDKEVISKLNEEQLTNDQTDLVKGGATYGNGNSCCVSGNTCASTGIQACPLTGANGTPRKQ